MSVPGPWLLVVTLPVQLFLRGLLEEASVLPVRISPSSFGT